MDSEQRANIRRLRKSANLTQSALARRVGITQQALSFYESGQEDLAENHLQKIMKILGAHATAAKAGFTDVRRNRRFMVDLSLRDLSQKTQISKDKLSAWERGKVALTVEEEERWNTALEEREGQVARMEEFLALPVRETPSSNDPNAKIGDGGPYDQLIRQLAVSTMRTDKERFQQEEQEEAIESSLNQVELVIDQMPPEEMRRSFKALAGPFFSGVAQMTKLRKAGAELPPADEVLAAILRASIAAEEQTEREARSNEQWAQAVSKHIQERRENK